MYVILSFYIPSLDDSKHEWAAQGCCSYANACPEKRLLFPSAMFLLSLKLFCTTLFFCATRLAPVNLEISVSMGFDTPDWAGVGDVPDTVWLLCVFVCALASPEIHKEREGANCPASCPIGQYLRRTSTNKRKVRHGLHSRLLGHDDDLRSRLPRLERR